MRVMGGWFRRRVAVCVAVYALSWAGGAGASQPEPADDAAATSATVAVPDTAVGKDLEDVLEAIATPGATLEVDRFSAGFLAQVPPPQLHAVLKQLRGQVGALELVSFEGPTEGARLVAICRAQRGGQLWRVLIEHDAEGQIAALLLRPAPELSNPELVDWTDLNQRLEALECDVSFGVYEVRGTPESPELEVIHQAHADRVLGIGSAFKLWVLGALAQEVATGEIAWADPLAITDAHKSLPSGRMQDEAAGTEYPVSHYAQEMIRISDNTATDHLLHLVGRKKVEAYMARFCGEADRNRPLLSTREMFVLKLGGDAELAARFAAADEKERRKIIAPGGSVAGGVPSLLLATMWQRPIMIDRIEWFASARECCCTMADLRRLSRQAGLETLRPVLGANPGLPLDKQVWPVFFYKGGSEPGVLNLTWLLERRDGRVFVVSFILNDTRRPIDQDEALSLAGAALKLLARQP